MFKLLRQYKNKLILVLLLTLALIVMFFLLYKKILIVKHPQSIGQTTVYINQHVDKNNIGKNQDVTIDYVFPYEADKVIQEIELYTPPTNQTIPLRSINFIDDTSPKLIDRVSTEINKNTQTIKLNLAYVPMPEVLNDINMINDNLGISYIVAGQYPDDESQILIPEIYAVSLVTKMNLLTYEELIGEPIDIEVNGVPNTFTIAGIYYGDSNSIYLPPSSRVKRMYQNELSDEVSLSATALTFESSDEKKQFIDLHPELEMISSRSFFGQYLRNQSIYIFVISIALMYIMLLRKNINSAIDVVNHYNYSMLNKLKFYILHIGFFIIEVVIAFIIVF